MDIGVHVLGPGQKEVGGFIQDRSGFDGEDCLQRNSKLARTITTSEDKDLTSSSAYCKTMSLHQSTPVMSSASILSSVSNRQEHMLSFSDKSEDFNGLGNSNKSSLSPFLHQIPPSYFKGSGGYGSGGMMMSMSMQGNFTGVKEPFTLSQWAELEQQALIYKYITANVPVPSGLLISIKKSFYPYGSLPPSSFGWGAFHLGFAGGNIDPEPGRCRRTDGKKWRCSRDAVPDQKYCERHINRGRHRSRKPVEVQAAAAASTKAVQQPVVAGGSNRSNSCASSNRSLAAGGQYINLSTDSLPNKRVRNLQEVSLYPSTVSLQPKESAVIHQKHRNNNNPFEFGHISSDSLFNLNSAKIYGSSFLDFSSNQNKRSCNHNPWQEEQKSDLTQLSMSSSPSSTQNNTAQDKIVPSPLRLSSDQFDRNGDRFDTVKKVNSWIPISWGNSSGGPLGEVLSSTTNSPKLGYSPTRVLQKSTFCSLSNSSSVSSPVVDNNRNNGEYFHYTT